MSFSAVGGGGFRGDDALLAFAAMQQSRMNAEMNDAMSDADTRSQAVQDLNHLKAEMEQANQNPQNFPAVTQHMDDFMAKYGDVPDLARAVDTVRRIGVCINDHVADGAVSGTGTTELKDSTVKEWSDMIGADIDGMSTNDQLAMIHIKQLNDNINNSSSMTSGIIESRQNATASIIQNIA